MRNIMMERRPPRRAAVVEESVLQRRRTAQLLTDELSLEITHDCGTLREFLSWLRGADRSRWPHLLVIDLLAGPGSGEQMTAVEALREAGIRVAVLSALKSRTKARRLVEIGVDGIVSTADSEQDFIAVAGAVLSGGTMITTLAQSSITGPIDAPRLSTQEERVLVLYASGLTISAVADEIGVRHDTARKYLNRVRAKLTASGRPARTKIELARVAWSSGYSGPENTVKPPP